MVVELNDLALGPVSPALALLFALLGGLLAIVLITRARRERGARRMRLLIYACVALAVTAIWQSGVHALMGLWAEGSVVRFDAARLAAALGAAVLLTMLAVIVLGFGRLGPVRLVTAAVPLAGAVALTQAGQLSALQAGGQIVVHQPPAIAALTVCVVVTATLLRTLARARSLVRAVVGAGLVAVSLTAAHLLAAAALAVRLPEPGVEPPTVSAGLSGMELGVPILLLGSVLLVMLWFLTLGTATVHELRAIFDPEQAVGAIEPWMIEQVRSRVALTAPAQPWAFDAAPSTEQDEASGIPALAEVQPVSVRALYLPGMSVADAYTRPMPGRRAPGPRPTPGDGPMWRSMPVWGRAEIAANSGSHPTLRPIDRNRGWWTRDLARPDLARNSGSRADQARDQRPNSPSPVDTGEFEALRPDLAPLDPDVLTQAPVSPATSPVPPTPGSPADAHSELSEAVAHAESSGRDPLPRRDALPREALPRRNALPRREP